jgi:hypothetical protein
MGDQSRTRMHVTTRWTLTWGEMDVWSLLLFGSLLHVTAAFKPAIAPRSAPRSFGGGRVAITMGDSHAGTELFSLLRKDPGTIPILAAGALAMTLRLENQIKGMNLRLRTGEPNQGHWERGRPGPPQRRQGPREQGRLHRRPLHRRPRHRRLPCRDVPGAFMSVKGVP